VTGTEITGKSEKGACEMHTYTFQDFPKEHHNELMKEAEIHRLLNEKGSKRGNGSGLVKLMVGKVEGLLATASGRLNERRHVSPIGGRFKEA
jgi:hypothetical protein